jgi:hypothetical protein
MPDMISVSAPLRLDTTGQFLGGPLVGSHDNSRPSRPELSRHMAQLLRIAGH